MPLIESESRDTALWWRSAGVLAAAALVLLGFVTGLDAARASSAMTTAVSPAPDQITGTLLKIDGHTLTIKTRKGATVLIDDGAAVKAHLVAPLVVGKAFIFQGAYGSGGKIQATLILRAKQPVDSWPIDR